MIKGKLTHLENEEQGDCGQICVLLESNLGTVSRSHVAESPRVRTSLLYLPIVNYDSKLRATFSAYEPTAVGHVDETNSICHQIKDKKREDKTRHTYTHSKPPFCMTSSTSNAWSNICSRHITCCQRYSTSEAQPADAKHTQHVA